VSWFNNLIGRSSLATKPRPQKLANFIDRLTPALLGCIGIRERVADDEKETGAANFCLEAQDQQFFYNGLPALEKR